MTARNAGDYELSPGRPSKDLLSRYPERSGPDVSLIL